MSTTSLYRRVVRRETHSPRSGLAIVLAVLLILALAWIGTEAVIAALGRPALLVAPVDGVTAVLTATDAPVPALTAAGAAAAVIGIILIVLALSPARRGRRGAVQDRTATVVDDRVIAQSIARIAAHAGDVNPDQVHVGVGSRSVRVDVTRTSGRGLHVQSIQDAVDAELAGYDYSPGLRARVHVSERGTVG